MLVSGTENTVNWSPGGYATDFAAKSERTDKIVSEKAEFSKAVVSIVRLGVTQLDKNSKLISIIPRSVHKYIDLMKLQLVT